MADQALHGRAHAVVYRISIKGVLRVWASIFERFIKPQMKQEIAVALQMGGERAMAHMD